MKKIYTYVITLLCLTAIEAQQITTVMEEPDVYDLAFHGNDMYVITSGTPTKLFKIDLTNPSATPVKVMETTDSNAKGMVVKGDYLYFITSGRIFRINVTTINPQSPATEIVASNLGNFEPQRLVFNGDDLYVTGNGKIAKIDTSSPLPATLITVVGEIGAYAQAITIMDNNLYYSVPDQNKIYALNLLQSSPTPNEIITNSPSGIVDLIPGGHNFLFAISPTTGKVYDIDLNQSPPVFDDVISISNGLSFEEHGEDYYVVNNGKVIKVSDSLFLNDFISQTVEVYPNPATSVITISGVKNTNYQVFNLLGSRILSGTLSADNQTINVSSLNSGVYVIKLEQYKAIKFLKH